MVRVAMSLRHPLLLVAPALALTLAACDATEPSGPPPATPPPLSGRTTTTLAAGRLAVLPLDLVVVTFRGGPQSTDAPALGAGAKAFVDHVNAIYERAPVRVSLRVVEHAEIDWQTWESHVPVRTVLPPASDPNALTLYVVPSLSNAQGAPLNGMVLGPRSLIVSSAANLRTAGAPSGAEPVVTEPVVRVSGHLLGSLLGLPVSKDPRNLMALGTTGTELDAGQMQSLQVPTDWAGR
jgi:hypothetical protein